jgi:hypothetical protein
MDGADRGISNIRGRDLFYHGGVMAGHGSYVNGRMIVRPGVTIEEIVEAHKNAWHGLQEYDSELRQIADLMNAPQLHRRPNSRSISPSLSST